ncbi:MAG: EamA family transporter [Phycisphaeraceae bacterium]|nr:EamA family transporter [Phycisphaeraceae bacterium]MCW5754282.1 EamA family transporter [Phycisphaeraceae bacterium]
MNQTTAHHGRGIGVLAAVMTLVGWSSVPLFIKYFSESIDAWTSNGWRYGFSALIWLPVALLGISRGTLPRSVWRAALIPAFFNSAGQICFTLSFYLLDPALVTFALRIQIVFVTIGAAMLFPQERRIIRSPMYLVGLAVLMIGTMATVSLDETFGEKSSTLGVVLACASGAFFAGYGLAVRTCMKGVRAIPAFAVISQYTAGVMLLLMLILGDGMGSGAVTALDAEQFFWLLASAIIGIALGHVFYYIAIERLGVAPTAGLIQLQPFCVGAAESMLPYFKRSLTIWQWVSGAVAVSGAGIVLRVQHIMTRKRDR